MYSYPSLRKQNSTRLGTVATLSVCVLLSAILLFGRLAEFSTRETCHYIPLTKSGGITTVTRGQVDANGDFRQTSVRPGSPMLLTVNPGFQVTDETAVWKGQTDIEIFRISYQNADGQVSVSSQDGEKLLAPGTANTYSFALENTGNVTLKYTMDMQAYFSHGEYTIPVRARVTDHEGNYLAGTAESMADVMDLNHVSDGGNIRAGYVMPYTLEWEWPFETDDAYDTLLGNLAVGEDIALTIVIHTMASYTPEPGEGIPQTGDTSQVMLYAIMMVVSLAGILTILLLRTKEGEHEVP